MDWKAAELATKTGITCSVATGLSRARKLLAKRMNEMNEEEIGSGRGHRRVRRAVTVAANLKIARDMQDDANRNYINDD